MEGFSCDMCILKISLLILAILVIQPSCLVTHFCAQAIFKVLLVKDKVGLQTTQEDMKYALPTQRKIAIGKIDVSVNQIFNPFS